jgi:hypothetical protein
MENDDQIKPIPVSNWTLATGTRPGERYVYSHERREGSPPWQVHRTVIAPA